ncbi:NAD(P)H dehydrogenase [Geomonas limicola]|uniref:NAD(P)H dehydrogenase n=1 Tax=Geomonas limicola TaxID=2740186 RepID=A0A6V8N6Q2_9BACT|nr:NAD(P)H dehydrogenase [Geomonas limicola]
MNILVVNAHPETKSFCSSLYQSAIATLTESGHTVTTSDLYSLSFQPVSDRHNFSSVKDPDYFKPQAEEIHAVEHGTFAPDLAAEMAKVEQCDLMIWHFPLWWFSVPAILKGWYDRVFAMGRFYGNGRFYETGMMRGKRAMLTLTTGGPVEAYQPGGFNGDMNGVLRPIQRGMFEFVGFSVLAPQVAYAVAHVSDQEREDLLEAYRARLRSIDNEAPITVGSY